MSLKKYTKSIAKRSCYFECRILNSIPQVLKKNAPKRTIYRERRILNFVPF